MLERYIIESNEHFLFNYFFFSKKLIEVLISTQTIQWISYNAKNTITIFEKIGLNPFFNITTDFLFKRKIYIEKTEF